MTHNPPGERAFGLSVGTVLLGLSAVAWWRGHPTLATALVIVGGLLVLFGAVYPPALRVPNRVWWRFAQVLGWVNARILLTVFFALVLTPVGVVMRACGRNPLRPAAGPSNWTPYTARRRDAHHYEHLF
jgi:hypothetical protein